MCHLRQALMIYTNCCSIRTGTLLQTLVMTPLSKQTGWEMVCVAASSKSMIRLNYALHQVSNTICSLTHARRTWAFMLARAEGKSSSPESRRVILNWSEVSISTSSRRPASKGMRRITRLQKLNSIYSHPEASARRGSTRFRAAASAR